MKVLGISPLDKDSTVSLVEDGKVLFAAGEERFSRQKQHAGFPHKALEQALSYTNTSASEIDEIAYPFLTAEQESQLMHKNLLRASSEAVGSEWRAKLKAARNARRATCTTVPGLPDPNKKMDKGFGKNLAYQLFGVVPGASKLATRRLTRAWVNTASAEHRHWQADLEESLSALGLQSKLKRYDHHTSHAANAFLASGIDRALIVTLDGYGTGLAGSVSLGENNKIKRLQNIHYPSSLGTFYEGVTAALGYRPDRHAGKIVGLAAYGDPSVLSEVLLSRFSQGDGTYHLHEALNYFFDRYLASQFSIVDVAAAYQYVLEVVATRLVDHWVRSTGCSSVVLSGGVTANVKMNQRIFEVPHVEEIFVYPNMGDGGCGTGLALQRSMNGERRPAYSDAYFGPDFTDAEMLKAIEAKGLEYSRPNNIAGEIAGRIHRGEVVARFDGRMEYGPRALGNRSILFHAKDPEVNQWLNNRLGRTEFMPFAPVTTWEDRYEFYENLRGAEETAQFMTITFDCTRKMKENCPAAVHVDGTARPQLIKRAANPVYYDILKEFEKLSGIPTLINTSFNMHEEPIVCSPADAVRAFVEGGLDVLALGPFLVEAPITQNRDGAVDYGVTTVSSAEPRPPQFRTKERVSSSRPEWCVRLSEVAEPEALKALWLQLQGRSECSFFQSWSWIEAWLRSSSSHAPPFLLECRYQDKVVGLGVLGHNRLTRHNVFSAQALLVSELGLPGCDALTVEHSGLLMEKGLETDVIGECLEFLRSSGLDWDELYVSGVEKQQANAYLKAAETVSGIEPVVRFKRPYFFVDLKNIRAKETDYLQSLSANTRYQIRRSKRFYEKMGPVELRAAGSLDETMHMFNQMKKIHQHSWTRRGTSGAFLSNYSRDFHNKLIELAVPRGQIQILQASAGDFHFGYLYNFVMHGVVYNYQSGFVYEDDGRYKPGLLTHSLAIEHNLAAGHDTYDLLMGDQRFKRSLALSEAHMLALVLRQSRVKLRLEEQLHNVWDRLRG